jgi:predicted metal-binding membrane protein
VTAPPAAAVPPAKPRSLARRHRDRLAVLAGLAVITAAAWIYLVVAARQMTASPAGLSGRSMAPMMRAMAGV